MYILHYSIQYFFIIAITFTGIIDMYVCMGCIGCTSVYVDVCVHALNSFVSVCVYVCMCQVLKIGLRKISISYSRISLLDVAQKLHIQSAEAAEYICAKAIRCE